ncbi:MAG: hypothetical protein DSZ24_05140, partial [Thermodesulfatator sp.]
GSYLKVMQSLVKVEVLILDDWGLNQLSRVQALDLLEVVEERYQRGSTVIIISEVPVGTWYQVIGDSTIADAILDRLVHNAYRVEMEGESMRRQGVKVPSLGQGNRAGAGV